MKRASPALSLKPLPSALPARGEGCCAHGPALPRASGPAQEGLRPVARRSPSCIFAFQVHHHFHGYPHAAHTPYARLWARAATCTFMSQSPARCALANSLSLNGLQNVLSCILKQAVLAAETGRIAARNGLSGTAICAYWLPEAAACCHGFGCALSGIGRMRTFTITS